MEEMDVLGVKELVEEELSRCSGEEEKLLSFWEWISTGTQLIWKFVRITLLGFLREIQEWCWRENFGSRQQITYIPSQILVSKPMNE